MTHFGEIKTSSNSHPVDYYMEKQIDFLMENLYIKKFGISRNFLHQFCKVSEICGSHLHLVSFHLEDQSIEGWL